MIVTETARLRLRHLTTDDADFIYGLVNQPSWLRFIGDKGVRNLDDARAYLQRGPLRSYQDHRFGLYLVELKESGEPIGICGLVKRDSLEDPDIGFALLPPFWGRGYALEAATAVLTHERKTLGIVRVLAIVSPDNEDSIKLLEKLGLRPWKMLHRPDGSLDAQVFAPEH
jgi:RimJ/RimL family protein N-acetyltransferase